MINTITLNELIGNIEQEQAYILAEKETRWKKHINKSTGKLSIKKEWPQLQKDGPIKFIKQ